MVEDQDLLLRTHETSRFACVPSILLGYREESLSLKKLLRTRFRLLMAILREAWVGRHYRYLVEIFRQALKAAIDIFAITSGLDYKMLRHRSGVPPVQEEIRKWNAVWASCSNH